MSGKQSRVLELNNLTAQQSAEDTIAELKKERDVYADALSTSNSAFREKVKELSILKRIGESMKWNLDSERICKEIVDVIIDETNLENCSLWLVDHTRSYVELKAAKGQEDEETRYFSYSEPSPIRLALGEGSAGWVAFHGTSLLIEDVTKSDRFLQIETKSNIEIKSLLCLPIQSDKDVIGVINMSHPDIGAFSKENERALKLITNHAALAFANLFLLERIQSFNERLENIVAERTRDLRYSENKYRSFVEQAGDAIIIVERDSGKITEVNSRACEYSGYDKQELVGQTIGKLMGDQLRQNVMDVSSRGAGSINGHPLKRKSGSLLYVDISANTIRTQGGDVIHLIIRDISERRQFEDKLKDYSERLESLVEKRTGELKKAQSELLLATRMAALGELASSVAHEINNPLAVISGYAEDMLDKLENNGAAEKRDIDELSKGLEMVTSQADRCQEITRSLLDFTRSLDLIIAPVDLNYAVMQAIHTASHKSKSKLIKFETSLAEDMPDIDSDSSMIEQIMLNILNNAVDAVGADGIISVNTRFESEYLYIIISDTGLGIREEHLEKIFDPFFTTKPVGKGTGFGLSICHKLAERLNGAISVASEQGKGTEFTIRLPRTIS
ncbi:hypothetical protein MNBD_NITROSPINAE03-1332 [hydrothermal vent metagenome]|uniref:Histidine kinase n=1 Tax=hydrothermal vent metagenome TaxID=652676 RepID=A0A3B1CMU0_9ZZZZ